MALGRRLVVIGDPDAGMHTRLMRAYGCGDLCIDMNGCPRCLITVVADITKGPIAIGLEENRSSPARWVSRSRPPLGRRGGCEGHGDFEHRAGP
ncbi:hypothetical protein NAEX_07780 [Nannocystis exedens]|nr:hypothetical protein NAEX_07780 [Nannocystis exedens]